MNGLDEYAVINENGVEVFFHQFQHLTVGLGDHRRLTVDVEQDAECTEVISR